MTLSSGELKRAVQEFNDTFSAISAELSRVIVGNRDIVEGTLSAIVAGGHVLLEGVPGLGKTLLVKSIARTIGLSFKRIQFTPDLMPSDVTGTQVLSEDESGRRTFKYKPGPIVANIVLADEINRATPKTQAALLEAMEERQVTVLGETHKLPQPFFVLATQNPVELEGTYPLPEAQLDRFLIKLLLKSPTAEDLKEILSRTTGANVPEVRAQLVERPEVTIQEMRALAREVVVPEPMQDVLVRMMLSLTPSSDYASDKVRRYVRFGPGPRGAQATVMMAKVLALRDGRLNVSFEDLRKVVVPCLRHRLLLNFQAEADEVTADDLLIEI
jgi:MoxR-like ATPase